MPGNVARPQKIRNLEGDKAEGGGSRYRCCLIIILYLPNDSMGIYECQKHKRDTGNYFGSGPMPPIERSTEVSMPYISLLLATLTLVFGSYQICLQHGSNSPTQS